MPSPRPPLRRKPVYEPLPTRYRPRCSGHRAGQHKSRESCGRPSAWRETRWIRSPASRGPQLERPDVARRRHLCDVCAAVAATRAGVELPDVMA